MHADEVDSYIRAAAVCAELIARLPPDRWADPAIGDWDLRALVGHTALALTNVSEYLARPAGSLDISSAEEYYTLPASCTGEEADAAAVVRRGRRSGSGLGPDPGATFSRLARTATDMVTAQDPAEVISTVAGGIRAGAYVSTRAVELVVHGHDIARAAGLPVRFPDDVLAHAAAVLARTAVARGHGIALIDGMTGRGDLPPGFSIV